MKILKKMLKHNLIVFLGGASYGVLAVIVKLAYDAGYSFQSVTFSQVCYGAILLWLITLITKRRKEDFSIKKIVGLIFVSGIPYGACGLAYYYSLQYLPASFAILLLFQFSWMVVLIEAFIKKEFPEWYKVLSVIILLGGTLLASGLLFNDISYNVTGVILGLLAGFSYAVFIISNGRVGKGVSTSLSSALKVSGSLILVSFVSLNTNSLADMFSVGMLPYSIPLALFGAVIPPFLFSYSIPRIDIGVASILSSSELPISIILSSIFLNEKVTIVQWFGIVLIIFAIVLPSVYKSSLTKK